MAVLELQIRLLELSDLARVDQFYTEHSGAFLPVPDAQDIVDAIEGRSIIAVEEPSSARLHAVAGLFPLCTGMSATGSEIQLYELAGMALDGTRVGGLQPYTLQELLISLRLVSLARSETENVCVVSSVVATNARSLQALEANGFQRAAAPGWLCSVRRGWCGAAQGDVADLVFDPAAIGDHAARIIAFHARPVLSRISRNQQENEQVAFISDLQWPRTAGPLMHAFVQGRAPSWETELPPERLLRTERGWLPFSGARHT